MAFPTERLINETTFPFLSLSLEIRHLVYEELLVCKPHRSYLLYHDRFGRSANLFLHPQILRVNKQISAEATPLLYEHNAFEIDLSSEVTLQCSGGNYPDQLENPPDLFRADTYNPKKYLRDPGIIYPHCMQGLANIEIIISTGSVWGSAMGGAFFTHIGALLLDILSLLAAEVTDQSSRKQKRLVLTVKTTWDSRHGGKVLFPRKKEGSIYLQTSDRMKTGEQQLVGELGPLLETVSKKRGLRIQEIKECVHVEPGEMEEKRSVEVKQRWVPLDDIGDL